MKTLLLLTLALSLRADTILDPGLYTQDIWTQTGPEYFSELPQAYGVPTNYTSAPGSFIIPTVPTPPVQQYPDVVAAVVNPTAPTEPTAPASGTPEPNTAVMVIVGLSLLACGVWMKKHLG